MTSGFRERPMPNITSTLKRRTFLTGAAGGAAFLATQGASAQDSPAANSDGSFRYEIEKSAEEWKEQLTDAEFTILRDGKTEPRFESPYARNNEPGVYHCKGCDLPIYESRFYSAQPVGYVFFDHCIPNSVLTGIDETDYNGALPEPEYFVEVHCRRCGSHLGHIFDDGPAPTGKRHCLNGVSLVFRAA